MIGAVSYEHELRRAARDPCRIRACGSGGVRACGRVDSVSSYPYGNMGVCVLPAPVRTHDRDPPQRAHSAIVSIEYTGFAREPQDPFLSWEICPLKGTRSRQEVTRTPTVSKSLETRMATESSF